MTERHKIWLQQGEAAEVIADEFGTQRAFEYLVGEKFSNFLDATEADSDLRSEIPAIVAKIKEIFEPWQLAQYLATANGSKPFDPSLFEEDEEFDAEEIEDMRKDDIRQCTRDPLVVEWATEWLLGETD